MDDNYRTKKHRNAEKTPFTNGLFFGLLLGILISIAVTLFITNGKSPFVSKETEGACVEVNSSVGQEDVINIDEDTSFDFYDTLPKESSVYKEEKVKQDPDKNRDVDFYIQVGAFSEESPADNLKAKLALMGFESVIMSARIGENVFHRVSVGPYQDYERAKEMSEKLMKEGFKSNLVKLTRPKGN
ncbi:MAG: SPOR domain-containing protein [Proteobacteria bacterium]|nr:SPOR domain-containing protein [Pseudomonadota bacterium]